MGAMAMRIKTVTSESAIKHSNHGSAIYILLHDAKFKQHRVITE